MICKVTGDGTYTLSDPTSGIELRADHLRRDHRTGEINGELTVSAGILGARTIDGILSRGSFNYTSVVARSQRAKLLRERARTGNKVDFLDLLEGFCQYIAEQEHIGAPAVTLRDVQARSSEDRSFDVLGLRFLMDHLSILFGAGDSLKSLIALYVMTQVAAQGGRGLYCDWELKAEDHRHRLEAICGPTMPEAIRYCRCDRPLTAEIDRLRRIVRAEDIRYVVLDSVAHGTLGDPAEAAAAMEYCRAVGQLGVGALAIAHITKSGDQKRKEDRKIDRAEVRKKKLPNATDAEATAIIEEPTFPTAAKVSSFGSWVVTLKWSEAAVDPWIANQREKAETILRILG